MRISDWSSDVCSSDLTAAVADLSQLRLLLEREDVIQELTPQPASEAETDTEDNLTFGSDAVSGEPPEDNLVEAIAAAPAPTGNVDVGRLWQALIEAEGELVTYGQVSEDSGYDRSAGRHKAHFDLLSGSFDFNRNDRVSVEREDRHGNWRPIGHLDLQRSKPDFIFIESYRPYQRGGASLVEQGEELRFRSWMEQKSLARRQSAAQRIVGRAPRTRDLTKKLGSAQCRERGWQNV